MRLEEFIAILDQAIEEQGEEAVPEGADYGGQGIKLDPATGYRVAYRNYCVLQEVPGGVNQETGEVQYGIYRIPDASGLSRFP
jgi:hypothetical protein